MTQFRWRVVWGRNWTDNNPMLTKLSWFLDSKWAFFSENNNFFQTYSWWNDIALIFHLRIYFWRNLAWILLLNYQNETILFPKLKTIIIFSIKSHARLLSLPTGPTFYTVIIWDKRWNFIGGPRLDFARVTMQIAARDSFCYSESHVCALIWYPLYKLNGRSTNIYLFKRVPFWYFSSDGSSLFRIRFVSFRRFYWNSSF